jgi:hypothetical protein
MANYVSPGVSVNTVDWSTNPNWSTTTTGGPNWSALPNGWDTFSPSVYPPMQTAEDIAIQQFLKLLPLITPNEVDMAEYPTLRTAYDEYTYVLRKLLASKKLKEAIDSYRVIEAFVKTQKENK